MQSLARDGVIFWMGECDNPECDAITFAPTQAEIFTKWKAGLMLPRHIPNPAVTEEWRKASERPTTEDCDPGEE